MNIVKQFLQDLVCDNPHLSLRKFKRFLDKESMSDSILYNFRGRGLEPVSESLSMLDSLKPKYLNFIKRLMKGIPYLDTPDKLVFHLNMRLNEYLDPNRNYESDSKKWKLSEYWESANDLYKTFISKNGDRKGDCDSFGLFKYHCLNIALKNNKLFMRKGYDFNYLETKWRLRCFVTEVLPFGFHFLLAWVKKGVNDWIPVESTVYPLEFERVWNFNMPLRDNYFYRIRFSFDDEHSYYKF